MAGLSATEENYWGKFSSQLLIPTPAGVSHITTTDTITTLQPSHDLQQQQDQNKQHASAATATASSYSASTNFAVTSGNRVQIFSSKTRKVLKTITRFGAADSAHSGHVRRDGRVLVAGGDSGAIQAFDVGSRSILKTWKEHRQPVWVTRWSPADGELTTLMSASDDKTVRLWDLAAAESVGRFVGHGDYVRCGGFMSGVLERMVVSGSYDRTVRLWDRRAPGRAAMVLKHGSAVEAVLPLPSGTAVVAASGEAIAVTDIVAGKPLKLLRNHQKTVTSLSLASGGTRVVSGGLDGHVKVFETAEWNVVAGFKYSSPILSLAVVPSTTAGGAEDKHLVVGMQSSLLSIKTRMSGPEKAQAREREKRMKALIEGKADELEAKEKKRIGRGLQKRLDGMKARNDEADIVVDFDEGKKRERRDRSGWRTALRKKQYEKALDLVLATKIHTDISTVLTTLTKLSALRTALSNRDETSLLPILTWLVTAINRPRMARQVVDVACLVLDLYAPELPESSDVWRLVRRLHGRVVANLEYAQEAVRMQGMVELIRAG